MGCKKKVIGGKKSKLVPTAILNPSTGKLALNKKEIREITLQYCINNLTSNKPEEEYREEIQNKKETVKQLLKIKVMATLKLIKKHLTSI